MYVFICNRVKIVLEGDAGVGKTSLLNRLAGDEISDDYEWDEVCLLVLD